MTYEPKSGLQIGVWFSDERCWGYKGTLRCVIQLSPKTEGLLATTADYIVSRCPSCEGGKARFPGRKSVRWIILPP